MSPRAASVMTLEEAEQTGRIKDLEKIWAAAPGIKGFLGTIDHKKLGLRYIYTAFAFLILGGLEALAMRLQLAHSNTHLLTPEQYNELFSTHGMTMIFLYAMPVLSGFSIYLWPLLFGTRDMAFPRLNAFSYWIYVAAGIFMYVGFAIGAGPNDGWFNYVPYASRDYNPGLNQDFYALGMIFLGLSTSLGAANFIVTFFRMRAPGMSINRVPIMTWGTLTASLANLIVIPAVSIAFLFLWMDRQLGTDFYNVDHGGQPMLWQHLFWIFGHPWVYAIVLPAMGMVSEAIPTFCRRPLVGYSLVALSTVATMLIGFGVWVHHMFATGLPAMSLGFFSGASIIITVPSAVAVFAWIATIWTGRPVITTAFLFFVAEIFLFVVGGVSGFMTASVPADWQLTDTYFVVAHIHYVLVGINLFPVIGAVYYWFPKMTGRYMNEALGRWNFWLMFIGMNIAFFPMHIVGLLGMPRRIFTYQDGMGWESMNMIITIGAFLFAFGFLLFLINVAVSRRSGRKAPANAWDGYTLEWSGPSPTPEYDFAVIPTIASRHPLWEDKLKESEARSELHCGPVLDKGRQVLATTALDAKPDFIVEMPEDTVTPFFFSVAMTVFFVALLFKIWILAGGGALSMLAMLFLWLWPQRKLHQTTRPAHG